jgi:acyl-CoA thioesterase-1
MRNRQWRVLRYCLALAAACAAAAGPACSEPETARPGPVESDARPVVLFLGTSLTAGYGLASEQAFPALVQQRIDAAGRAYRVVNAGVSGDTSAGGLRRIEWLLQLPVAVLVLELGANDMLRGLDPATLHNNLQAIIDRTRSAHPKARLVVAGMRVPPNLGPRYVDAIEAIYPELAKANGGLLIPFILEGVAGDASLNQADGIHPTAEGHRRIARTVWEVLEALLREGQERAVP